MNQEEVARILTRIVAMDSQHQWTEEKALIYAEKIKDLPYPDVLEAMKRIECTRDYRPTISQLLEEIVSGRINFPTEGEARGLIEAAMRAGEFLHTEFPMFVEYVIGRMGGKAAVKEMSSRDFAKEFPVIYEKSRREQLDKAKVSIGSYMIEQGQQQKPKAIQPGRFIRSK